MVTEIVGWIATVTACSFLLPQVFKVITTKSTDGLSIWFTIISTMNGCVWTAYGVLDNSIQVTITNAVIAGLSLIMFSYKLYNIIRNNDEFNWPFKKKGDETND